MWRGQVDKGQALPQTITANHQRQLSPPQIDKGARWGELESEPEESSEEEEEEEEEQGEAPATHLRPLCLLQRGNNCSDGCCCAADLACLVSLLMSTHDYTCNSRPNTHNSTHTEQDEEELEGGIATDATGLTSAGLASTVPGTDSPEAMLNLRKSGDSVAGTESARAPQLYTVLEQRKANVGQVSALGLGVYERVYRWGLQHRGAAHGA